MASWDQEVTDVDVLDIVKTFNLTDLNDVYIHLGLTHIDIANTKRRDTHSPEKQAQNILNLWSDRNSEKATRSAFIKAAEKVKDCKASLDTLKKEWTKPFDGPSTSKKRKIEAPHSGVSEPLLKAFKNELIDHYKREMGQLPLLPWLIHYEKPKAIDDIFVDLQLATKEGMDTEPEKIDNYEDLVTLKSLNEIDKYAKRVLVLGDAGSGKTSLMSKIAHSWSQQNHPSLNQFELVFHLRMRDLHSCNKVDHCLRRGNSEAKSDCSLLGEVFQQMPQTKVNRINFEKYFEKYIQDNPHKILILLDGWDESVLTHKDLKEAKVTKQEHDIENLLISKKQPSSCVIVTSRPYKSLGEHQAKYIAVDLKGFSDENVKKYIRKFYHKKVRNLENVSDKESTCDDSDCEGELKGEPLALYNRVQQSSTLRNLAKVPVMLLLICWMWKRENKLPEQQTELYYQFVCAIWERYCIREKDQGDELNELIKIGEIAFKGIKDEKLVFEKNQLSVWPDTGVKLGLLIEEEHISGVRMTKSISFVHKSFQEYCAAYFLVKKPDVLSTFLESLDNWVAVLSKQEVLLFCCGLCRKFQGNDNTAVNIIKHAIACCIKHCPEHNCSKIDVVSYNSRVQYNILPVLNLSNECGLFNHEDLNKPFEDLIKFDTLTIHNTHPQTLPIFHQFVKSKKTKIHGGLLCNIQTVKFDKHTCASLDVISDTLRCMPSVSDVIIGFSDDTSVASQASMTQLSKSIAKLSKLSRLTVKNAGNRLDISVILYHLSESPNKTLKHIQFNRTDVGDAISHMGGIIPHLVCLRLEDAALEDTHITVLCGILPNATCLERLDLTENPIGDEALHTLFTHIHHCVSLKYLRIVIPYIEPSQRSPLVLECVTAASTKPYIISKLMPTALLIYNADAITTLRQLCSNQYPVIHKNQHKHKQHV